jgi:undecaprenyl-diphosphatase
MSAALAAPLGRDAALTAASTGAAQEKPVAGAVLGLAAAAVIATRPSERARQRSGSARAARMAAGVGAAVATRALWKVAPGTPAVVAPHRTWTGLDPAPDGTGVGMVINPSAGSDRAIGSVDTAALLRQELPGAEIIELDDPSRMLDELQRLAKSGIRALGIAGGDGSINTAAGVALEHGLPLVVVPAGTLNHLARDLGVETVDDAITAVKAGTAIEIDVARIADRPFLNTASFGSYVEIVDAREQLEDRIGKWPALAVAVSRVLRRGEPVEVEIDGERQRLWAVFIGNCAYQPEGMAPTWRDRLDDGEIDVRVADAAQPFSRVRLVLAVVTGRLHRSPIFRTWRTDSLTVVSANGPLRLARDGETFDGRRTFEVGKNGDRLAVYTPDLDDHVDGEVPPEAVDPERIEQLENG